MEQDSHPEFKQDPFFKKKHSVCKMAINIAREYEMKKGFGKRGERLARS